MRPALLLPLAFLTLAACKADAPSGPDPLALMGRGETWQVAELRGTALPEAAGLTMAMRDEGLIGGFGGCNRYNGRISVSEGKLHMGELAGTRMMCDPKAMRVEGDFHAAMAEARDMALEGETLVLRDAAGAVVLRAHR